MSTATITPARVRRGVPKVLVVDDEPSLRELAQDLLPRELSCRVQTAATLVEARRIIDRGGIDLLLLDVHLPDGDGLSLLEPLRRKNPAARAVVISGDVCPEHALTALRGGAIDFIPKPFAVEQVGQRLGRALARQQSEARDLRRLTRLRDAVRRLNRARKTVSKKVDLLCNDLVHAYTDLARQLDEVRTQESFRALLAGARDLEQMLCHAMDWLLRKAGYCNIAIYLADDDRQYELGAYMKYTIPGTKELTNAMRNGILGHVVRDGFVAAAGTDLLELLSPEEIAVLHGQTLIATTCNYLGESLAALVLYRDEKSPFSREDEQMLKAIAPLFATALTSLVHREAPGASDDDDGDGTDGFWKDPPGPDDPSKRKRGDRTGDADWWKRGEPPPF